MSGATWAYPITPGETLGSLPVWLLEVTLGGRTLRFATEPGTEITTDDGDTLVYDGGLRIDHAQSGEVLTADGGESSISIRGLLPGVDVAQLVERGGVLDAAPAEVSIWYSGRTYEQRVVVIQGRTWLPEYGGVDEPIALTVEAETLEDTGRVINGWEEVNDTTWPSHSAAADGETYPLILGRPDFSPAHVIDTTNDYLVIAGHPVEATSVEVINLSYGVNGLSTGLEQTLSVTNRQDANGVTVATVDYTGITAGLTWSDNHEYAVRWQDANTNGGGALSPFAASDAAEGLGDICRYLLRKSSVVYDDARWAALGDHLNRFTVGMWLDDPRTSPWDVIRQHLLPLVPVSIQSGPRGIYPTWWNVYAVASDAVAAVDADEAAFTRVSGPMYHREGQPVNELTLEYWRWRTRSYRKRLTYTGRDVATLIAVTPELVPVQHLRDAYIRAGGTLVAAPVQSSIAVYDTATAHRVLSWRSIVECRPRRRITYLDSEHRYAWLEPGQIVTLTDTELYLSDRVARVNKRMWGADGSMRLEFELWDVPARDPVDL